MLKGKLGTRAAMLALIFAILTLGVSAAVVLFSSHVFGQTDITAGKLSTEAAVEFSMSSDSGSVNFTEGGEQKIYTLELSNSSGSDLEFTYAVKYSAPSELASAVLVYYDGEFLGTLGALCSIGDGASGEAVLGTGYVANGSTDSAHTLTFELHEAAPDSYYDNTSLSFTLTSYTKTIDYTDCMLVTDANELAIAIDDINSGMLSSPKVILGADVSLNKNLEVTNPATFELNGYELDLGGHELLISADGEVIMTSCAPVEAPVISGSIVLSGGGALLNIHDFYDKNGACASEIYGSLVSLTSYDVQAAEQLMLQRLGERLPGGVAAGSSVSLFGGLNFYTADGSVNVTTEHGTHTAGILQTDGAKLQASYVNLITVGASEYDLRIIGKDDAALEAILAKELAHLPTDGETRITSDLFLPKAIKSRNATIIWTSGDEDTVSSDGRISNVVNDNQPVTLFATIRINDKVYTEEFAFRVSSQNNETKFSYLVAQLSPITLSSVYDPEKDNGASAYHHLPIVDPSYPRAEGAASGYDYRESFSTPDETRAYAWVPYRDIGLQSLEYSVTNTYNYITVASTTDAVTGNAETYAYLNTPVFYTYAQIEVTGYYSDTEYYTETVNVIIQLGNDTELQNKVFRYVESLLNDVDILENILTTRREGGMLNERGDFTLPAGYMTYELTYDTASSLGEISAITPITTGEGTEAVTSGYLISVDPSKFYSTETPIGITVGIKLKSDNTSSSETRILYFNAPAVIKPNDGGFANLSVFNSVKYQIYSQLPDDERIGESGFLTEGTKLTNNTGAYILMRDASHANVTALELELAAPSASDTVNYEVYTLSRLLEWATASSVYEASDVWTNAPSESSDGHEYITNAELEVIKSYWQEVTGAEMSDEMLSRAFETAPGRVIVGGAAIGEAVQNCSLTSEYYFKYTEVLYWALDKQNYGSATGNGEKPGSAPDLGSITRNYTFDAEGNVTAISSSMSYTQTKYWTSADYEEDSTTYISVAESEVIKALILSLTGYTSTSVTSHVGLDFVDTFNSNTIVPTYLRDGGVGYLATAMYEALGADASGFISTLTAGGIPTVTALDNSLVGIQYLRNLTTLRIKGDTEEHGLSAFLTSSALLNFFNQLTTNNTELVNLEMIACARNYVKFDVEFTERLTKLEHLNYAANSGITNVGPLVNLKMAQLTYVNIAGVNVSFEFSEYVMENIYAKAKNNPVHIYYTPDGTTDIAEYLGTGTPAESLTYLNEIGEIKSEYLQLCHSIITGSASQDGIIWRIETGNTMHYVTTAGNVGEIASADAMNSLLANYYYCSESIPALGLTAGNIYKISLSGSSVEYTAVGTATKLDGDIPDTAITDEELADIGTPLSGEVQEAELVSTQLGSPTKGTPQPLYESETSTNVRVYPTSGSTYTSYNNQKYIAYVIYTTVNVYTYKSYTYTDGSTTATETVYYYTEDPIEYDLGDATVSVVNNSVIKCEYQYDNYGCKVETYTVTETLYSVSLLISSSSDGSEATEIADENWYRCRRGSGFNVTNYYKSDYTVESNTVTSDKTHVATEDYEVSEQKITSVLPYYYYVGDISTANAEDISERAIAVSENSVYYLYTGADGSSPYYISGTDTAPSYENGSYYKYTFDENGYTLTVTTDNDIISSFGDGTGSMDAILSAANAARGTSQMLLYYGMYYGYAGMTVTTAEGNTYEQLGIYRLLLDENGYFYFEHDAEKMGLKYNEFTEIDAIFVSGNDSADQLLKEARDATAADEGKIYYYTGGNDHYHQGTTFYILSVGATGEYMFQTFGAVYTDVDRISNERLYSGSYYGGTGGTQQVVISATVTVDGVEYVRKFLVDVIG